MSSHVMSIDNLCIRDTQEEDEYNRSRGWATPEDWDYYQDTIRRLYLDEKRPLKDVVVIMESDYGFRATAKMYKTRLAKWKMLKNRPRTSH